MIVINTWAFWSLLHICTKTSINAHGEVSREDRDMNIGPIIYPRANVVDVSS